MSGAAAQKHGAFYGRRKGKRLRSGQDELLATLLPRLRLDPLHPLQAWQDRPVWLEIGFGGGEHLVAQARAHPEIGFIGCEPFVNGVAKILRVIEQEDLDNIRIWDADASALLDKLPPGSVDRTYLLYPDPWPKRRHRKRRFLSSENLEALARIMAHGAELRFATDVDDYAGWALARILRSQVFRWNAERAREWSRAWPDWPGTRYEAKALGEKRKPVYLTVARI